jgi:hypothetical protein
MRLKAMQAHLRATRVATPTGGALQAKRSVSHHSTKSGNHHLSPSHTTWVTLQLLCSADPPARVRAGETCTYTLAPSSKSRARSDGRRRCGRYPRQPPLKSTKERLGGTSKMSIQGGVSRNHAPACAWRTWIGTAFIPAPKSRSPAHCTASLQRASLPPAGRPRGVPHLSPLS